MQATKLKNVRRTRRKIGIRKNVIGTPDRPRLSVFRSLTHIYAQIIDDHSGRTLAAASSVQDKVAKGGNKEGATVVGKILAERAKAAGISKVAFDRSGFKFHGRIKALADAARKAGLQF